MTEDTKSVCVTVGIMILIIASIFGAVYGGKQYHANSFNKITGLEMKCNVFDCYVKDKNNEWTTEDAWLYNEKYHKHH